MQVPQTTSFWFKTAAGILSCYVVIYILWNGKRLIVDDTIKGEHQEMVQGEVMEDEGTMTIGNLTTVEKTDEDKTVIMDNPTIVAVHSKNKQVVKVDLTTPKTVDDKRAEEMDKLALFMMEKTEGVSKDLNALVGDEQKKAKGLTLTEYKKLKAKEYIRTHANPAEKTDVPPTIKTFGPEMRPNPHNLVRNVAEAVQTEKIREVLKAEKERRMALADDDILEIPEVKDEIEKNPKTIPNIIHFVWYSCHRYRVHHLTSMLSAVVIQKPRVILLHTNCVPEGDYWDAFVKRAGTKLKIAKRSPPTSVWGIPVNVVEHQSDVSRLQILLEAGGIYLDCDSVILKSLDPFRKHEMVLGEEDFDSLGNGIMLANRNAWFLKRWYQEYRHFDDSKWGESSVLLPFSIWQLFPTKIHVVKEKMLRPNWREVNYIFQQRYDWSENYALHLYARFMQKWDGTPERSLRDLAILNTTYGEVSRYILWGNKKPRDIAFLM